MTASQDKVQGILETVLQDSIPLVHKGIFSSQQLQNAMHEREKQENNMLKATFKRSDYLKAIQFEYRLERIRRYRVAEQSKTNPLFKKQSKTDFIIIKRTLRLWDRTMHKYKYNMDLWKQYLAFCITIQSKKHFYKALSTALRIMPTTGDLIRIGVQYEIQCGNNLWKARKILIKGLKLNDKDAQLWFDMLRFEIYFLKTIHQRQSRLQQSQQPLRFIGPQQSQSEDMQNVVDEKQGEQKVDINLQKHDEVMLLVIQQCLSKFEGVDKKMELLYKFREIIVAGKLSVHNNKELSPILHKILSKIDAQLNNGNKSITKPASNISINQKLKPVNSFDQKFQRAKLILAPTNTLDDLSAGQLTKLLSPFLTKPHYLSALLLPRLNCEEAKKGNNYFADITMFIAKSSLFKNYALPTDILSVLITQYILKQKVEQEQLGQYIKKQINYLGVQKLKSDACILQRVIAFNKHCGNHKNNTDMYRRLSVAYKSEPSIAERCIHLIHNNN